MIETIWDLLGKKVVQIFGKECASASLWMFCSMCIRATLIFFKLDNWIPYGIIFALPYFIQQLESYCPFVSDVHPILPTRLAESILGRISPSKLTVIIPAHFLGCIFGAVLFKTICPLAPDAVFEPVTYDPTYWFEGLIKEAIVVCIYVCTIIGVPDLLEVNRLPAYLLSAPILPMMLIKVPNRGSTFNPAALYALWYINGNTSGPFSFQAEHMIGPVLGSIAAGIICSKLFPDDPNSWKLASHSQL